MRKSSFAPFTDARTRLLVLGSLPGEMSLAAQRYYANPRNQFWRLIGAVIDVDLVPLSYEERLATLLRHRVGLWDVVGSALRPGSLDGAIREHEANPLAELAAGLPDLRAVAFNGGTSARLGMKELGADTPFALVPLPSSSPAFTLAFEIKLERWLTLRAFLA
ncbi:DNA-deoxyinosine glycosylase [Sphingomonas sp. LY54]|uniref:DNA-deoxyinosine glycosylase n=1 Tax=Sphingomonas sp. LY54 TaxID=3095343 RepID=UPI002D77928A|nr:DNA-deoxyinosine glycosylase [Sphingomonas sp. LY54]WRP29307.1 DNA-deoxyinosine glycosylase [Sphingomonas sp. LY54]